MGPQAPPTGRRGPPHAGVYEQPLAGPGGGDGEAVEEVATGYGVRSAQCVIYSVLRIAYSVIGGHSVATVRVKWLEKLQFVGIDATKHSVVMSGQGKEDGVGMSPSQLLLVALGGCTAYDVVNILTKKRQQLTGLEVEVTGE
ncbi:MAG TPA: hypothetical protein ENK56_10545, partial [Chloroflexi bacterium]|nr:hypothetical protein [Chloroflexota bacterium]